MRRITCDHDEVYSGQINLSGKYAFICRQCGECGWSESYDIHLVNADEYYAQRVAHGWNAPVRLPRPPRPPRLPSRVRYRPLGTGTFFQCLLLSALTFVVCAMSAIPWPSQHGHSILPLWSALLGCGVSVGFFTLCLVAWMRGF